MLYCTFQLTASTALGSKLACAALSCVAAKKAEECLNGHAAVAEPMQANSKAADQTICFGAMAKQRALCSAGWPAGSVDGRDSVCSHRFIAVTCVVL